MKKLTGIVLCLGVMMSSGFAMAEPQVSLSPEGHKIFDALINGEATVDNCVAGDTNCTVKLAALHDQMLARHNENDACKSKFSYTLQEIDCGGDGVPDLLIDYHGMCTYDFSEQEVSGVYVMIYRDAQGNYHVGNEVEYWERSSFNIHDRSFYGSFGSCGADCFIMESGVFDKQCKNIELLKIDHSSFEDELFLPGMSEEGIVPVEIDGKIYYRFLSDEIKDEQILAFHRDYSRIKRYSPKKFHKSFDIASRLLTKDKEAELLKAAQKARLNK